MRLFRRRPLPDVVRGVALPPGERRADWAVTAEGAPVVATGSGLLLPGREGVLLWREVETATWDRPLLSVREVTEVAGSGPLHELTLADEGGLPELVRDRVTSSVAWTTTATLSPGGSVRIVGRRVPGAEELLWQLVYEPGTDLDDPLVRAQAEHALRGARTTVG